MDILWIYNGKNKYLKFSGSIVNFIVWISHFFPSDTHKNAQDVTDLQTSCNKVVVKLILLFIAIVIYLDNTLQFFNGK
jgi:hypothetical protein